MVKDNLLKHSNIMLVSTVISMFFGYLFQIFMGRMLGPSDYGILGSIVSILYIVSIPLATIQTVITFFVSKYNTNQEYGKIHSLLFKSFKKITPYTIVGLVFLYLSSWRVADFLNIPTNMPLIIFSMVIFFSILTPITFGVLQGLQNFNHLALNSTANAALKLVAGIFLVYIGFGVNGAIAAYGASTAFAFILCYFPLRFLIHQKAEEIGKKEIYDFSLPVLIVTAAFSIMMNIDLIIVKHYLNPVDAGYYTAASMIAKVIYFSSTAISSVMFPKVTVRHTSNQRSYEIISKSILYMTALSAMAVAVLYFFSGEVIGFLYGKAYISIAPLMVPFCLATTFFSVANIISFYQLSTNNSRFVLILIFSTIIEVVLMILFHNTILQIIMVLVAASFLMLMLLIIEGTYSNRKRLKLSNPFGN